MIKLNTLFYPITKDIDISKDYALDILSTNDKYMELERGFLKRFDLKELKTFSFNSDGFLSLLCELGKKGKIAISRGETLPLVKAGEFYESLGFDINWIPLLKNGKVDIETLKELDADYIFISSFVMDTFVKTELKTIKEKCSAKIISNASYGASRYSNMIYFDPYKLSGFGLSGALLFNDEFEVQPIGYKDTVAVVLLNKILSFGVFASSIKGEFKNVLCEVFGDDLYFFVDLKDTFDESLHFGLKGIKARELIRTLALDGVSITNGEGCSLGLSIPSPVIQAMGYDEDSARNSISLSFCGDIEPKKIKEIVNLIYKRYRQIRILN